MYGQVKTKNGAVLIFGEDCEEYIPLNNKDQTWREDALVLFDPLPVVSTKRKCKIRSYIHLEKLNQETVAQITSKWDQEALRDDPELFVRTDAFEEIFNNEKIFLIGRKGTGKSAIAKALIMSGRYSTAQPFSFQHFPFSKFFKLGVKDYSHSQFKPIWEIIFITLALGILQNDQAVSSEVRDRIGDYFAKKDSKKSGFFSYLPRKIASHPMAKFFGMGMGNIIGVNPVEVVNTLLEMKPEGDDKPGFSSNLMTILDELKILFGSLNFQGQVLVVFDELDEEYKVGGVSHDWLYSDAIRSLFAAALGIHQMRIGIKPLVLLREDIFDSFEGQNKGKLKDFVCTLNWSKDELKQVIGLRMARTFGKPDDMRFEKLWLSLFTPFFQEMDAVGNGSTALASKNVKRISSYEAFMRHTARTPRDCIQLLLSIAKQLKRNRMTRCDKEIFGFARPDMADYFHQQVVDASHTRVPKINEIFRTIEGDLQAATIGKKKLLDILIPVMSEMNEGLDDLLHILYDVSAIGILDANNKFRAKHTCSTNYRLKKNEQIVFHPCLALYFGLDISIAGYSFMNEYEGGQHEERNAEEGGTRAEEGGTSAEVESPRLGGFTREMLNTSDGIDFCKTRFVNKTWLMTLTSLKDGIGWLSHSEFPDRVYCDFKQHSVEPELGMRFAAKIEVIESAKYGNIFAATEISELA